MQARALRRLLWLLGFGCLWLPVLDDPPLATGAYVQDVRADRATVCMVTPSERRLRLAVHDAEGRSVAELESRGRRHVFPVPGLAAGRSYSYVLREASGAECDQGSFRTPPADDRTAFRFTVLGDSGALPWWVWLQRNLLFHLPAAWEWLAPHERVARMGEAVASSRPDFLLHVGDIVYPWGHQGHYAAGFFRPFGKLLRTAPCYVTLGNHDVLDDGGRQALANFVLPVDPETGDERQYAVVWGALRIIVLDCNSEVGADHPTLAFLRRELAAATEPWLVVVSHYPILSASRQGDRADLVEHLLPELERHGVDLYLSGHDHTYQRLASPGGLPLVVAGGGGKSLYELREHPAARVLQAQYHYCTVDLAGPRLLLRAQGLAGGLLDTLRLDKAADGAALARIRSVNPARAARIDALLR